MCGPRCSQMYLSVELTFLVLNSPCWTDYLLSVRRPCKHFFIDGTRTLEINWTWHSLPQCLFFCTLLDFPSFSEWHRLPTLHSGCPVTEGMPRDTSYYPSLLSGFRDTCSKGLSRTSTDTRVYSGGHQPRRKVYNITGLKKPMADDQRRSYSLDRQLYLHNGTGNRYPRKLREKGFVWLSASHYPAIDGASGAPRWLWTGEEMYLHICRRASRVPGRMGKGTIFLEGKTIIVGHLLSCQGPKGK